MRGEWFLGFYLLRRYRYRHHRHPSAPRPQPEWVRQARKREVLLGLRLLRAYAWPLRAAMRALGIKPRPVATERHHDELLLVRPGHGSIDLTGWDHPHRSR